jgi:hypothetical protein
MKEYTEEELQSMTLEQAVAEISNSVYEATRLIEILEGKGKIRGNGHHARQNIAVLAEMEVKDRWQ